MLNLINNYSKILCLIIFISDILDIVFRLRDFFYKNELGRLSLGFLLNEIQSVALKYLIMIIVLASISYSLSKILNNVINGLSQINLRLNVFTSLFTGYLIAIYTIFIFLPPNVTFYRDNLLPFTLISLVYFGVDIAWGVKKDNFYLETIQNIIPYKVCSFSVPFILFLWFNFLQGELV